MKLKTILFLLIFAYHPGYSQDPALHQPINQKGRFYVYWGWNRGWFSESDIHFKGSNFDFVLQDVLGYDHPTKFSLENYFSPFRVTIPQVNFKLGYFIDNHYSLSIGFDHMKYVVEQDQVVNISGQISDTETIYDGTYSNDEISIKDDFLKFEHTNGLNYINVDARRFDQLADLGKITINLTEGLGGGILVPRTNCTLFGTQHNDTYHLSGYGFNGIAAINIGLFKIFFIQSEYKFGIINMPDIIIPHHETNYASQSFLFQQVNLVFGATFGLGHSKNKANHE